MDDTEILHQGSPDSDGQTRMFSSIGLPDSDIEANENARLAFQDGELQLLKHRARHPGCRERAWGIFKVTASVGAHIGFLVCIICVAILRGRREKLDFYHLYLLPCIAAALFYIIIVIESAASNTHTYLRNFTKETVEEFLDHVTFAAPQVMWHAKCYHFRDKELENSRQSEKSKTSCSGKVGASREKVVTHTETQTLKYQKWRDVSRDIKGFLAKGIARVECSKLFIFKDDHSHRNYLEQLAEFRDRNRQRDIFVEFSEVFEIAGFQERVTACAGSDQCPASHIDPGSHWNRIKHLERNSHKSRFSHAHVGSPEGPTGDQDCSSEKEVSSHHDSGKHERPFLLQECWYWLFSLLLLTWLYRFLIHRLTTKVYVIFVKELEL